MDEQNNNPVQGDNGSIENNNRVGQSNSQRAI